MHVCPPPPRKKPSPSAAQVNCSFSLAECRALIKAEGAYGPMPVRITAKKLWLARAARTLMAADKLLDARWYVENRTELTLARRWQLYFEVDEPARALRRAKEAARHRGRTRRARKAGKCLDCPEPPEEGRVRCRACMDRRNARYRSNYAKRKGEDKCVRCGGTFLKSPARSICRRCRTRDRMIETRDPAELAWRREQAEYEAGLLGNGGFVANEHLPGVVRECEAFYDWLEGCTEGSPPDPDREDVPEEPDWPLVA